MRVQIRKIICATDFSDFSRNAVLYGVSLAKELDAKVYVCHVIDVPFAGMYGEANPDPVELHDRSMSYAYEHINGIIDSSSVDWEPLVTIGHTADEITRMAEDNGADLVVCGNHGRSGLKRLLLGSVTERLMRVLPCPLLVVKGPDYIKEKEKQPEGLIKKILVGCDFSQYSSLAFKHAVSLAQEFEAELHLVHVVEPSVYKDYITPDREASNQLKKDLHGQLREKLEKQIPEEARNWCVPKTTLMAGQPHEELTKYAVVNDIDLIALGAKGGGLVETLFVGSNTDRVIRQSPCPVLSVRPTEDNS